MKHHRELATVSAVGCAEQAEDRKRVKFFMRYLAELVRVNIFIKYLAELMGVKFFMMYLAQFVGEISSGSRGWGGGGGGGGGLNPPSQPFDYSRKLGNLH